MRYNHPFKVRHPDIIAARERAHAAFDLLWKEGFFTKQKAYSWLASKMGLSTEEAHIGRFHPEQCDLVVEYSVKKYQSLLRAVPVPEIMDEKKHNKMHKEGTCRCPEYDKWYASFKPRKKYP